MKKLVILDLMGTLLEADCVVYARDYKEYNSRISSCGRQLNNILGRDIEVIILTSFSHTTLENESTVLNDIYNAISNDNKERILFMLTDIFGEEKIKQITKPSKDNIVITDNKLKLFTNKDEAYKEILDKYYDYSIISVDDFSFTNRGFADIYLHGGRICYLLNNIFSKSYNFVDYTRKENLTWKNGVQRRLNSSFPYAGIETYTNGIKDNISYISHNNDKVYEATLEEYLAIINYLQDNQSKEFIDSYKTIEEQSENKEVDTVLHSLYNTGKINTKNLRIAMELIKIKKYFTKYGYDISLEELITAYKYNMIITRDSFNDAYQRVLKNF